MKKILLFQLVIILLLGTTAQAKRIDLNNGVNQAISRTTPRLSATETRGLLIVVCDDTFIGWSN